MIIIICISLVIIYFTARSHIYSAAMHYHHHQTDPVDNEVGDILVQVVGAAPKFDSQRQDWAVEIYL